MLSLKLIIGLTTFVWVCFAVKSKNPVIFINPFLGSALEGKIHQSHPDHWYCSKSSDYFGMWFELHHALPLASTCLFNHLDLTYNPVTDRYYNHSGVDVRPARFGDTYGGECIFREGDICLHNMAPIYELANELEKHGWTRDYNIHSATYDFRLPPQENEKRGWFNLLKALVETTYRRNSNKKVIVTAHSMGGMMGTHFFNIMSSEWKDKYIDSFHIVASPLAGSLKGYEAWFSGETEMVTKLGVELVDIQAWKRLVFSWGSLGYFYPREEVFGNEIVITTPTKKFTSKISDVKKALSQRKDRRSTLQNAAVQHLDTKKVFPVQRASPGVDVHCLWFIGSPTTKTLHYDTEDYSNPPTRTTTTLGDGTVLAKSASFCKNWANTSKYPEMKGKKLFTKEFVKIDVKHNHAMQEEEVYNYIVNYARTL
eukprot:TRINITY_DN2043_c0_g1_i1.p1 TRINITY_DN2043_c0_g1~~TRINITY_DN2043_c0_g1_i1.p1  ORF type:complete len:436 (+),score=115.18 TRINITY_DN2043_c0_g1_i1:31-1308(+)